VQGFLIFGIDTQANNKSGNQAVLTVDGKRGFHHGFPQPVPLDPEFLGHGIERSLFQRHRPDAMHPVQSYDVLLPVQPADLERSAEGAERRVGDP